jgi:hypothetical protein
VGAKAAREVEENIGYVGEEIPEGIWREVEERIAGGKGQAGAGPTL